MERNAASRRPRMKNRSVHPILKFIAFITDSALRSWRKALQSIPLDYFLFACFFLCGDINITGMGEEDDDLCLREDLVEV
jgi:hypothetical protein